MGHRRIGESVHRGTPPEGGQRDGAVVQSRATTDQQVPPVWVSARQVPSGIGVEAQAVRADPPVPGLRVVHRRCPGGQTENRAQVLGIRKFRAHRRRPLVIDLQWPTPGSTDRDVSPLLAGLRVTI